MKFKVLEIRDEGTHIPALAILMLADSPVQSYYIHKRCGYARNRNSVVLMKINDARAECDPYKWNNRTMANAHHYILAHFDELNDGDVIDVQFILGETAQPKTSERFGNWGVSHA